jgi:hypothetical protein
MGVQDPTLKDDVRRRVAMGLTPEMAAASRKRFALLQGTVILALALNLISTLNQGGAMSVGALLSIVALAVVVVAAAWRYWRLSPRPGQTPSDSDVDALLGHSYRCARCNTVVLPAETECPQCGAVKHPRWTLAFGIVFGFAMFALALWRAGVLAR